MFDIRNEKNVLELFNHLDSENFTRDELADKEYIFDRMDIWLGEWQYEDDYAAYERLHEMYLQYLYNKL
jgi:hypothetical protein